MGAEKVMKCMECGGGTDDRACKDCGKPVCLDCDDMHECEDETDAAENPVDGETFEDDEDDEGGGD